MNWITIIGSALSFLISLLTGKKEDTARSLGMDDQKLADARAQAEAEKKADAVDYPDRAAADEQLRQHKF